ncbi:hypothetical protein OAO87_03250 [bacterium]|nr:hypothetical protein [bacterium]
MSAGAGAAASRCLPARARPQAPELRPRAAFLRGGHQAAFLRSALPSRRAPELLRSCAAAYRDCNAPPSRAVTCIRSDRSKVPVRSFSAANALVAAAVAAIASPRAHAASADAASASARPAAASTALASLRARSELTSTSRSAVLAWAHTLPRCQLGGGWIMHGGTLALCQSSQAL